MNFDCTLDSFKLPGMSGIDLPFGTKNPNDVPVWDDEAVMNAAMPFMRQRPFLVNEDSTASRTDTHSLFVLTDSGVTLTLGSGGFIGCKVRMINASDGACFVADGVKTAFVPAGSVKLYEWAAGGWQERDADGFAGAFSAAAAPFLISDDKRRLTLKAGTKIRVGDTVFAAYEDIVLEVESLLDTGSALVNGKDYYVFIYREENGTFTFRVSLLKDAQAGYAPDAVKLIGGFHTLCADAGTGMTYVIGGETRQHPLNGFTAGDILPASVYCLNHRPFSEPEGMVYIPPLDFWADIYLPSGMGADTKSAFRGAITRNRQYVDFVEDMICVNKTLLSDEEFAAAMMGSNEKTAVYGASETGATNGGAGGRSDTAGRRMISIFGVEEGCGSLWQWLASTSAAGGSGWNAQSGGKGDFYGACLALLAGGGWGDAASCGSRARIANHSRASADANVGGRGRSRPQNFTAY
jgi:hypothetical protein